MKIGFLGSKCNPVGVRALERSLGDGSFDVLAGIEKKVRLGLSRTTANETKGHGHALWFPRIARVPCQKRINSMKLAEKA